mmetsp:Transcript_64221/g.127032  ORF Transcript_64221/g.127032 Transcript_64221/m.127032 type:complete len:100 (+) Transcript_64221:334-633(+)
MVAFSSAGASYPMGYQPGAQPPLQSMCIPLRHMQEPFTQDDDVSPPFQQVRVRWQVLWGTDARQRRAWTWIVLAGYRQYPSMQKHVPSLQYVGPRAAEH